MSTDFFHNQEIYRMLWYLFYNQVWTSKKPTIYIYFLWVKEAEHWHKQRPKLQGVEELLHVRGRPRAHREQEETRREGVQGGAEQVDRPSSERRGVRFHFPDAWRQQRWAYQHREWVEVFKVKQRQVIHVIELTAPFVMLPHRPKRIESQSKFPT